MQNTANIRCAKVHQRSSLLTLQLVLHGYDGLSRGSSKNQNTDQKVAAGGHERPFLATLQCADSLKMPLFFISGSFPSSAFTDLYFD
jgi:hypothetical protein